MQQGNYAQVNQQAYNQQPEYQQSYRQPRDMRAVNEYIEQPVRRSQPAASRFTQQQVAVKLQCTETIIDMNTPNGEKVPVVGCACRNSEETAYVQVDVAMCRQ